jgi:alkyldihydroxyacetonephosphate synthase
MVEFARDCWPRALWWSEADIDAHTPSRYVRPETVEELVSVMRRCSSRGTRVLPRGGGSGVLGAAIPDGRDSLVVDLTGLAAAPRILEKTGDGAVVTAGAGIYGDVLERELQAMGLSCAHFPASMEVSTLGGWVATDGWGQCSTAYGPFRDRVVSVDCVLADGTVVSGADPAAWIGSEGSLGIVTDVAFRAVALPRERTFASFEFDSMRAGFEALRRLHAAKARPAVARLYDGLDRVFLGPERGAVSDRGGWQDALKSNLLRLRGRLRTLTNLPLVRSKFKPLLVLVMEGGESERAAIALSAAAREAGGVPLGEGPARSWWERRYRLNFEKVRQYRDMGCFVDTLDVSAPWDKLERVYEAMHAAAAPYGMTMAHASHLNPEGACLYFTLTGAGGSRERTLALYQRCWSAMMDACVAAGGRPDHHHGVGLAKRPWLEAIWGAGRLDALRDGKRRLDPSGIMQARF